MKLSVKQTIGIDYLQDDTTKEVVFGGGAGGGKSFLGCYWVLKWALKLPDSRWMIGRSERKNLNETTLVTFFKVCKDQGLKEGVHYKYNSVAGYIKFFNGSVVLLKDLKYYPSDPDFDSLGSLEITGAFIDEIAQISKKAWDIVKSRIRHKLDVWDRHGEPTEKMEVLEVKNGKPVRWRNSRGEETIGLKPKIFGSCNPNKGFAYKSFYDPWKKKTLKNSRKFVQSLVDDNPNISDQYIENLDEMDKVDRDRLRLGKWEFEENEDQLMSYDAITNYFTNNFVERDEKNKRITIDVARKGKDGSIIRVWYGYVCVQRIAIKYNLITELAEKVRDIAKKERITMSSIIADEDGVGGGLVDILKCKGFIANSRPLEVTRLKQYGKTDLKGANYVNFKAQCTFVMCDLINSNKLYEAIEHSHKTIEMITEEMEWVRRKDPDKDTKNNVISKDIVKENIGRSPDDWDSIMMLGYFELTPKFFVC